MEFEFPADFIGHPVADSGADRLIEEEGFERFLVMAREFLPNIGKGELRVLRLRGEFGPRIENIVQHDAAEHAVVVEYECGLLGAEDEVVVLYLGVVCRSDGEFPGHPEVDFKVKFFAESEEHALTVGARGEEFFPVENSESRRGTVTIDARPGVGFRSEDLFPVKGCPLAAGEFDFG